MLGKKYKVRFLPIFERDLNEKVVYISETLENPVAALALIDAVEMAIEKRSREPLAFAPYPSVRQRRRPYYRIRVKRYVIFYVVIGDVMEVRRILYAGRDFEKVLGD